jgi:thymidine phosphorylase
MVEAQGGDPGVVDDPLVLGRSSETMTVPARQDGYVQRLDARLIGEAAWQLGAGRQTQEHEINPHAGLVLEVKCGDALQRDQPWATLFHGPGARVEQALEKLAEALQVGDDPPSPRPLIWEQTE